MKKETKTIIFLAIVIGLAFFLSFYPEIKEYFSSNEFMQFFAVGTEELTAPASSGSGFGGGGG